MQLISVICLQVPLARSSTRMTWSYARSLRARLRVHARILRFVATKPTKKDVGLFWVQRLPTAHLLPRCRP